MIINQQIYTTIINKFNNSYQQQLILYDQMYDLFKQVSQGLDDEKAQQELDNLTYGHFKNLK
jgi:hypothetical protein